LAAGGQNGQSGQSERVQETALQLVDAIRSKHKTSPVEALVQSFSLSTQEGVALMCLAEALLRVPDHATRDALIRDKVSKGDWRAHLDDASSMFVSAATWGLLLTGKLVSLNSEKSLSAALTRIIGRGGEPLIRKGVDLAMRLLGEQFVCGQSIAQALSHAAKMSKQGFRYSFDMLGEAAMTASDADRYNEQYTQAIHAIGKASAGQGIYEGNGISIKLSALHPRYVRAKHDRVMNELYPRLLTLVQLGRHYDIGINIDAEEADRLDISLDVLERLCMEPSLAGWNGLGTVIQAYQKRALAVVDFVVDLARRSNRRMMVRLVKGAYWDTEIKRAQVDGLEDYPVFTRKVHTDVSYLACARRMLDAPQYIFAQFATHNAQTLAAIYHMAGGNYYRGQYEFQCLHGMGEPMYEEVVKDAAKGGLNRPCRIYAPVGTHETLLPYLVRRLLENGANSSFVNQIHDPKINPSSLVQDPVRVARSIVPLGSPHPKIPAPIDLYRTRAYGGAVSDGETGQGTQASSSQLSGRQASRGIDLSNEARLASLAVSLMSSVQENWQAAPMVDGEGSGKGRTEDSASRMERMVRIVRNPADQRDVVGEVSDATPADVAAAIDAAQAACDVWQATPADERAAALERAADLFEANEERLIGLVVREAGKTLPTAIGEVREAVDFLRYYAIEARSLVSELNGSEMASQAVTDTPAQTVQPLGVVACISPWNFPLAIFTGQVSAALVMGSVVLAKPAEQTSLIACEAVRLMHEAGVPTGALQCLPGLGQTVGQPLVASPAVDAVMFTGSTETALAIQTSTSQRLNRHGQPVTLIAETGGLNALVVDSSALPEQVVADVIMSAFDSAGQRCSALRVLLLQEDSADTVIAMLKGAMDELALGNPARLSTDIGPVIDSDAMRIITDYIAEQKSQGRALYQAKSPGNAALGNFVVPTLVEVDSLDAVNREVFGPVLHVVRYQRKDLDAVLSQLNAKGFGLTFGVHTRIDEMSLHCVGDIHVG
ncbi:MAG TPA: bifunctional proline dehydrogenase/L-glutamate gamma-semialdehyde dehydrogenase PutA, partial [Orrella sp.]